jgi:hypothetical protein
VKYKYWVKLLFKRYSDVVSHSSIKGSSVYSGLPWQSTGDADMQQECESRDLKTDLRLRVLRNNVRTMPSSRLEVLSSWRPEARHGNSYNLLLGMADTDSHTAKARPLRFRLHLAMKL